MKKAAIRRWGTYAKFSEHRSARERTAALNKTKRLDVKAILKIKKAQVERRVAAGQATAWTFENLLS